MGVYKDQYETVAASQTDQVLGSTGAAGDRIYMMVVTVTTAATSTVSIKDGGGSAISVVPANTPVGVYSVDFGEYGARAKAGAWQVTTGAGASVIAIGDFR